MESVYDKIDANVPDYIELPPLCLDKKRETDIHGTERRDRYSSFPRHDNYIRPVDRSPRFEPRRDYQARSFTPDHDDYLAPGSSISGRSFVEDDSPSEGYLDMSGRYAAKDISSVSYHTARQQPTGTDSGRDSMDASRPRACSTGSDSWTNANSTSPYNTKIVKHY